MLAVSYATGDSLSFMVRNSASFQGIDHQIRLESQSALRGR